MVNTDEFIVDRVSGFEVPLDQITNFFKDTPEELMPDNPYEQFVLLCQQNLGFATKVLLNIELLPYQQVILEALFHKPFPLLCGSRGAGKSFILAVYACLRALLTQGTYKGGGAKIMFVGAAYRQSQNIFNYIKNQIYPNAPLLQQCSDDIPVVANERCRYFVGNSSIMALPLGDGQKIRGERATHLVVDEFSSISEEIFNIVVRGFAAVSADPVARVKEINRMNEMRKAGIEVEKTRAMTNQIALSGTMYYSFNHFYKKKKLYEMIIKNRITGDMTESEVKKVIGEDGQEISLGGGLDYRDYVVITLPSTVLPKGVLDEKILAEAKASMPRAEYLMEYECVAPDDSDGFFKRSLIDACEILAVNIEDKGNPNCQYVMGCDPARKNDNFAICILKLRPGGSELVYATSLHRKPFPESTAKVRELFKKFNIVHIAMDAGGGGSTVQDLLSDKTMVPDNEEPIYAIDDEDALALGKQGKYVLEMVNFTPRWIADANFDLKADLENRRIFFPRRINDEKYVNSPSLAVVEDAWDNIQETKIEMTRIVKTSTPAGNLHFDVQTYKGQNEADKRKDRYSALLLAAYAARSWKKGIENKKPELKVPDGDWLDRI